MDITSTIVLHVSYKPNRTVVNGKLQRISSFPNIRPVVYLITHVHIDFDSSYGLIRQNLNGTGTGTGTGKNVSLYIMLNASHCSFCVKLNGTYTLALYHSRSRSCSRSHISSV